MRLDKLHITKFKNLVEFDIDFDQEQLTTVLIGENGTGKSNLLEALVLIFRNLHLGRKSEFGYKLDYICRGHIVHVEAYQENVSRHTLITVDGKGMGLKEFSDRWQEFLPKHVFAYYSGPSRRLEEHFDPHMKLFYDALIDPERDDEEVPLRPLFFCRLVHSQFVLMAYFSKEDSETRGFLADYLQMSGLESILFVMNRPAWAKRGKKITPFMLKHGDDRFWYSRGAVKKFLNKLWDSCLAPIYSTESVTQDFRGHTADEDRIYLFLPNDKRLGELARNYPSTADFFKYLESTYVSDLIKEVRVRVRRKDVNGTLMFKELSEGEQQLLTVLGLLKFTKDDESLFLLDEPDTHLNPKWKLNYLRLLEKVVAPGDKSHLIITTHDPLVIAGLTRNQVQIFSRSEKGCSASPPDVDPRGLGVAGVLTEMFSLPSTLDPQTQAELDLRNKLFAQKKRTAKENKKLSQLSDRLASCGFTRTFRDPLYERFI
ncbi:MAG: AAA family ATPase, partial [Candidatus Methanoperedens sp.]